MGRLLRLVLFTLCFAIPSIAHGHDRETPERKGIVLGMALQPGIAQYGRSFVPVTRLLYIFGGGVSDRVTLTGEIGIQALHGHKKVGFVGDVVATGFLGRGFLVRAGAGVVSHAIANARDPFKPGFGGLLGVGYEFRVLEKLALAIGVDYDVRMRTDRLPSQTLLIGLRLGGYLRK